MITIYAGDTGDLRRRIRTDHCSGNVEGSAFRWSVAENMGFKIKITKRPSGSDRKRIDLPDPREGERLVSEYIRSGMWQFVECSSKTEAYDFQWYVIEKLNPLKNKDRKPWDISNEARYHTLLIQLEASTRKSCNQSSDIPSKPGVYVFYHPAIPSR